jgi:hypothetical protein
MRTRLIVVVFLMAISALPAVAQQATRADFDEYAKAMVGRWVGQVTFVADWPGIGKKGDKVTGYGENKLSEDGNALITKGFSGTGSGSSIVVYDAAAKQIKELAVDSGGTVSINIYWKVSATQWAQSATGSLADGSKLEGKYEGNISENGNTWTWTGTTTIGGQKQDDLHDVWRRVSKQ